MAASSAPAVKAQLLTLLRADSALSGVQITYSHPGATIQQECVYFNRTVETERPAALGQRRQNEDYYMEVVVDVAQDGDDAQVCEERCWALVAEVENTIRNNNGPGGALATVVSGWVVFGAVEMTPFIERGQRLAEAVCRVQVVNRK